MLRVLDVCVKYFDMDVNPVMRLAMCQGRPRGTFGTIQEDEPRQRLYIGAAAASIIYVKNLTIR